MEEELCEGEPVGELECTPVAVEHGQAEGDGDKDTLGLGEPVPVRCTDTVVSALEVTLAEPQALGVLLSDGLGLVENEALALIEGLCVAESVEEGQREALAVLHAVALGQRVAVPQEEALPLAVTVRRGDGVDEVQGLKEGLPVELLLVQADADAL